MTNLQSEHIAFRKTTDLKLAVTFGTFLPRPVIIFDENETSLCVTRQLRVGALRLRAAKRFYFFRGEPRRGTIAG